MQRPAGPADRVGVEAPVRQAQVDRLGDLALLRHGGRIPAGRSAMEGRRNRRRAGTLWFSAPHPVWSSPTESVAGHVVDPPIRS
ncbi:hypothetical protein Misp04_19770 [Micromonospora sp. NBRC 101691]|nr:hypothetical protein Misp04_19770 [Micromonospora sp. NBRC 101691]